MDKIDMMPYKSTWEEMGEDDKDFWRKEAVDMKAIVAQAGYRLDDKPLKELVEEQLKDYNSPVSRIYRQWRGELPPDDKPSTANRDAVSDEELNKAYDGAFDKPMDFDHKPTADELHTIRLRAVSQATISRRAWRLLDETNE